MRPMTFLIFLPFIVILYFLFWRPQQQRVRRQQELIKAIDVGDRVVTAGGLIGRVVEVNDDRMYLEVADGVVVEFLRLAISRRLDEADPGFYGTGLFDDEELGEEDYREGEAAQAQAGGAGSGAAESGGAESGGAESGGGESGRADSPAPASSEHEVAATDAGGVTPEPDLTAVVVQPVAPVAPVVPKGTIEEAAAAPAPGQDPH